MREKLPIAIISAHGSLAVPPEIESRIALSPEQIFNEADVYVDELFDFRDQVLYYETFPYARTFIDANRPSDANLHRRAGDGAIKLLSSYGDEVYKPGQRPDGALTEELLQRYWLPWHEKLTQIQKDERVKLVIDCHSMAAVGPDNFDDPHTLRPRICVSNLGGALGEPEERRRRVSATPALTRTMADIFGTAVADVPPLTTVGADTAVNDPFWGGWAIWAHGFAPTQPWLLMEINRGLYIGDQHPQAPIVPLDPERLHLLRARMWSAISAVTEHWLVENARHTPAGNLTSP